MSNKIHKSNGANDRWPGHKRYRKYPVGARHAVPLLCFLLLFEQSGFAQTIGQTDISGYLVGLRNSFVSDKFRPLHLRYLQYFPEQNRFRLLVDVGTGSPARLPKTRAGSRPNSLLAVRDKPVPTGELLKGSVGAGFKPAHTANGRIENETKTLLRYFFIGLTLPNDSFWVNLRPDSPDNIIDPLLAQTDVGKILLEADLQLKKDAAKYTSPETPEGREYWDKLYQKAGELFGSENITIPTLTRPWIVPDEIIIREAEDNAYIYKATLKVVLEEDYLNDNDNDNDNNKNNCRGGFQTRPYDIIPICRDSIMRLCQMPLTAIKFPDGKIAFSVEHYIQKHGIILYAFSTKGDYPWPIR